ncbi:fatty acid--CoA ligase family protein [Spongiactinospora sp. TRM90649]|uniref:class I adenylate-forming enzyme family protein n=1 Tax=Spongiactinospora sp. TRM90649 TaxID=3031114 RepID=UPI0023F77B24|nr:fatty acid--CoA ligase family protein [Spongiactinospora sp. TRM90649]MDF5756999.1 fatty acid--CoA ligase family protein [Spongiactinospora sp. TRM90649]
MRDLAEPVYPRPVLDALREAPRAPAFEQGSRTVSRGGLLALVSAAARGMASAGLGPGRATAIATALTPEGYAAALAAHALGCRVVGVRPGWSERQFAAVLGRGIDAVIADGSPAGVAARRFAGRAVLLPLGRFPHSGLLAGGRDEPPPARAGPDDIARVNYTSGSTGDPKGCSFTYRAIGLAYRHGRWAPGLAVLLGHFTRFLAFGSWSLPVMTTFAGRCLLTGGTVVLPEGDPYPALAPVIERHRITAVITPVPGLHRLLAAVRDTGADVSHLRALVVTGSPAAPRRLAEAVDLLGEVVWQGYGQAESGMISLLTPGDIAEHRQEALRSVGRPLPAAEVTIRDAGGEPLPPGEIGEIHVRGPHIMREYWNDRAATAEVLDGGLLRTRDLGHFDRHGLLHLTGRTRDVIMVNAETCHAVAIERVLSGHDDVDQAYVVGVPDEETGEAVHAFVVPRGAHAPGREVLAGMVRAALGAASVPRTVTVLREVPLTAAGKPDRRALAVLAAGGDPAG